MPLFIIMVAIILIAAGINDKLHNLKELLVEDFSPSGGETSFQMWAVALVFVGVLGYSKTFRPFANMFLALIIVAIFVQKDRGFFSKFMQAIEGK